MKPDIKTVEAAVDAAFETFQYAYRPVLGPDIDDPKFIGIFVKPHGIPTQRHAVHVHDWTKLDEYARALREWADTRLGLNRPS